jgi:hypothetical protein
MLTDQLKDTLQKLRDGKLDVTDAKVLEQIPAHQLVADLSVDFPVVFQERVIGRKHEIGLARSVRMRPKFQALEGMPMPVLYFFPSLVSCVLVSSYDDAISEVTCIRSISLDPGKHKAIRLRSGPGNKLDKSPDGWTIHALDRKTVRLKFDFLVKRGWNFDPLRLSARVPKN